MGKQSAGILLYRMRSTTWEVFLVHPGGPFWARKDAGAWSIPKGEFESPEAPEIAARREFEEETGTRLTGELRPLRPVKQAGGKMVYAFAVNGDVDPSTIRSNTFSLEFPPKSGRRQEFPEIDRAEWFTIAVARGKILNGQVPLLEELGEMIGVDRARPSSPKDEGASGQPSLFDEG